MAKQGVLLVISAPSGAGKLTLLNKVRESQAGSFVTTVSATTRSPRTGEEHGRDYYFLSREEFELKREAEEFVEWAEVHGNLYGTLFSELDRCLATGKDVILELDVQGMESLKEIRHDVVTVFLMPPSLEVLENRLRNRGTDEDDVIALRLKNASDELAQRHGFDYIVVNDKIEQAASDLEAIIRAERCRAFRQP
ncbi:MAG: guanylate kinase [Candidatus Hydrogenedentes bacterium]|nr:guanylate kinase [Candidatus Hydrogenedentota bacterium]